jgi:hypothetical protein
MIDEETLKMLGFRKKPSGYWVNEALHLGYDPEVHSQKQFWINFLRNVVGAGQDFGGAPDELGQKIMKGKA